jgi:hypothetical protein
VSSDTLPWHRGEEVMALGGKGGDRAVAALELLHDGVVACGEEPDGSLPACDLGRHGAGVAVLDTVEARIIVLSDLRADQATAAPRAVADQQSWRPSSPAWTT